MAKQVRLLSRSVWLWGGLLALPGCRPNSSVTAVPPVFVSADQPGWQQREGQLWLNNKPFDGWQYQRRPTGDTAFVGAYVAGKAEGQHRSWYPNRQRREIRNYRNGWQEGEQRGWFESGKPAFIYHFRHDVYEGSRKEWYVDGRLARAGNYHEGQEAGLQQLWFGDGSPRANYVARGGRNYGFTGVKNCVNVWDSITVSH